ncbi:DPP IV N-terminal domain-containing protein [Streptomonospora alba]|uniref:DPP IV N-terminal domain-containing protein n=1 Tax=Streptomonospora alba TaxID=183763 RepID=UPI001EE72984|nr:DPP IV N-terminal domain-containing protein [Streptomonospora alba]
MTTLVTETGRTRGDPSPYLHAPPGVRILDSGEILWWSQRDGWGHLYRYSSDGELLGRVTGGQWLVRRVLRVAEERGQVLFLANGLNEDPYVRQICRVDLDGGGFVRVTDDDLDHDAVGPTRGDYIVDRASTVARPVRGCSATTARCWSNSRLRTRPRWRRSAGARPSGSGRRRRTGRLRSTGFCGARTASTRRGATPSSTTPTPGPTSTGPHRRSATCSPGSPRRWPRSGSRSSRSTAGAPRCAARRSSTTPTAIWAWPQRSPLSVSTSAGTP